MQEREFMGIFNELCVAFGKGFDREQALVYFKYLGEFDKKDLQKAVEEYVFNGGSYFPRISEIIDKIHPMNIGKSWQKVVEVAAGGCRDWRQLTDVEIDTVSAIGGMHDIQNADEQGLHFIFLEFNKIYPMVHKRQVKLNSDAERLKILNVVPETYQFLKKAEKLERLLGEDNAFTKTKDVLPQVGEKI